MNARFPCCLSSYFDTLHFSAAVPPLWFRLGGSDSSRHTKHHLALIKASVCFRKDYFTTDIIHHPLLSLCNCV